MTDDNQTAGDPSNSEPQAQFGSGEDQTNNTEAEASFGKEDITKILKQNTHAQDHIRTLEMEAAELRQQLKDAQSKVAAGSTIDDLLDGMATNTQSRDSSEPKAPQIDTNELVARLKDEVFKDLSAREQAGAEDINWKESVRLAQERHGERYAHYVDQRAQELGMAPAQMEQVARTSPQAFMQLLGGSGTGMRGSQPTMSSITTNDGPQDDDFMAQYRKVATTRFDKTDEGFAARRLYQSEEFQRKFRDSVLKKMSS